MVGLAPRPKSREQQSKDLPPLYNGDRLDQPTFHARYEAMPEDFRAELIGGIVYVPSPLKRPHGRIQKRVLRWLMDYEARSPGTEAVLTETIVLDLKGEPEPDACLRLLPQRGGKTREIDHTLQGPPELIVEVAASSVAYDLHLKKDDYERAGVLEYLVLVVYEQEARWLTLRNGQYAELAPGDDGILRSEVFPGLWLDPEALFRGDMDRVAEVLQMGLSSAQHAAWVAAGRDEQAP
jgi:Uma2 family endonuclease